MLVLVEELVGEFDLQEQGGRVQIIGGARLFVLPGLLEIGAVAWTIERHFALFAAALRADAAMHGGTEALFLTNFADGTTHDDAPGFHYGIRRSFPGELGTGLRTPSKAAWEAAAARVRRRKGRF